jgi:hypothetical protein
MIDATIGRLVLYKVMSLLLSWRLWPMSWKPAV